MRAPFAQEETVRNQTLQKASRISFELPEKMLGLGSLLLLLAPAAALRVGASPQTPRAAVRLCDEAPTEAAPEAAPAPPAAPARYDVSKLTGDPTDIGKSTLDPVLSTSAFLSRRRAGAPRSSRSAAVEARRSWRRCLAEAETVVGETATPSGLQYVDLVKGRVGDSPKPARSSASRRR